MDGYNPAVTGAIQTLLNEEAVRRALGQPAIPEDKLASYLKGALAGVYEPWMQTARFEKELGERRREFDIKTQQAEELERKQEKAQAISGLTQLGAMAGMGYMQYKMLQPILAGMAGTGAAVAAGGGGAAGAGAAMGQATATGLMSGTTSGGISGFASSVPGWGWAGIIGAGLQGLTTGDWGKAAKTGAATAAGAYVGSAILPGIGTIVGGAVGGLASKLTVICTELYRQGFIDEDLFGTVHKFTDTLPWEVRAGYYLWAVPVVSLMRRSKLFALIVYKITLPIMEDIANRVSREYKHRIWARVFYKMGEKICKFLGKMTLSKYSRRMLWQA